MQHANAGPQDIAPGTEMIFPSQLCANCGTRENISMVDQDTRKTSYFILGGTELTFQFPVATCSACAKSLKRRPRTVIANALISIVAGFVGFAFLLIIAEMTPIGPGFLAGNLVSVGGVIAAAVFLALPLLQRPAAGQTSYFQPVRLVGLKRRFIDGRIECFKFRFTNSDYREAFISLNADAIENGLVEVRH